MPLPNKKRLQVFVSSTYEDLKKERQAAVETILQAGHIPAGMELFAASNKSQMEVIKRWIDESDVFLLILGGRYGSVEPESNKSYTHLEYEYAIETKTPLFACMIREETAAGRGEKKGGRKLIEKDNPKELANFRKIVRENLVEMWSEVKDIQLGIVKSLSEIERDESLKGWVREENSVDVLRLADEVARLSKENARLREQGVDVEYCGLSYQSLYELLKQSRLIEPLMRIRKVLSAGLRTPPNEIEDELLNFYHTDPERSRQALSELVQLGLLSVVSDGIKPSSQPEGISSQSPINWMLKDEAEFYERIEITADGKRFLNRLISDQIEL